MHIVSLKNQKQFDLVNKFGYKQHGKHMLLVLSKNFTLDASSIQPKECLYFGMKVSTRFAKTAVVRNKTKRHIRHIIREYASTSLTQYMNIAIIIIPKKSFINSTFIDLTKDFHNIVHALLK